MLEVAGMPRILRSWTSDRGIPMLPMNQSQLSSDSSRSSDTVRAVQTSGRRGFRWWGYIMLQIAAVLLVSGAAFGFLWTCSPHMREWLREYGSVPVVAAIVGWGTNVVAIYMTFYPLEFVGCCPKAQIAGMPLCGWQGIIPANCQRMAEQAVDLMTSRLFDVSNTFQKIDPSRLAAELRPPLENLTPKILETIAEEYVPRFWGSLPAPVQNEIKRKCLDDSEAAIAALVQPSRSSSGQAIDTTELLVNILTRDKQLVNDIFLKCAAAEFRFIRVSGIYLGFLFGLVQMGIWYEYKGWWVLPVAGFVVGYLTNWVALKIIFQPVNPRTICCCTVQGLFLRRQHEVATDYARLLSSRVLTAENLFKGVTTGSLSEQFFQVLDENIQKGLDKAMPQRVVKMVIGSAEYSSMKARVSELIRQDIEEFTPHLSYVDQVLDVQQTLETSMRNLTAEEFEDMLHPVFQEGELKLVLIGGFLGVVVGMVQALIQVPEQLGL